MLIVKRQLSGALRVDLTVVFDLVPSLAFSAEPSPCWVEDPSFDSKTSPERSTVIQSFSSADILGNALEL